MDNKKFRKLKIDNELKDLLPPQTEDEHKILEECIKKYGCTNPLITWNDYIVDGHNRYGICEKYKIGFEEVKLDENFNKNYIKTYIIKNQLGRRNISNFYKVELALKYKDIISKEAKINQGNRGNKISNQIDTRKKLSDISGVGRECVWRVEKILKECKDEYLINKLRNGDISINKAYTTLFKNNRKQLSNQVINSLMVRSKGKCECCGFGGYGLENIMRKHHKVKYSNTKNNSLDNLILLCPNCHSIIHTLENCKDNKIKENILNNINNKEKIIELVKLLNN